MSRLPRWFDGLPADVAHALGLARAEHASIVVARCERKPPHRARVDGVRPDGEAERALMETPGFAHDGEGWVWIAAPGAPDALSS